MIWRACAEAERAGESGRKGEGKTTTGDVLVGQVYEKNQLRRVG